VLGVDLTTIKVVEEAELNSGRYSLRWDGLDEQNVRVPPGPYWIVLRVGEDYSYWLAIVAEQESVA
jgi:hypothetical protein